MSEYKKRTFKVDYTRQYDTSRNPFETDEQWMRRLAKVADQRLVRLEQAVQQGKIDDNIFKHAYGSATKDIEALYPEVDKGRPRYNRKIMASFSPDQQRAVINSMRRFIESPSSSINATKQLHKHYEEKYGVDYATALNIFESKAWDNDSKLGSKTKLQVIATIRENVKSKKDIDALRDNHKKISDNDAINNAIETFLAENKGLTIRDLKSHMKAIL